MKPFWLIICFIHCGVCSISQEIPNSTVQQLENIAMAETETEDDSYLQELEYFKKHPLNLNTAEADQLKSLRLLSDLQIGNIAAYKHLFGGLSNIYELQAIPSWDIVTIKKILPFVQVVIPLSVKEETGKRFSAGEHVLLLRASQILEKSAGYNQSSSGAKYNGSPQRILFRYRYSYKDLLQYGITGDKDAGESFFKGAQKTGFDFYSIHFFARRLGKIQALAIGDFTVNMGQGLIQWQGMAFKKSAETMAIKRQSAVLRPYNSAGEFYFHRGAGITLRKRKIDITAFVSYRKLNANTVYDTADNETHISSLLTSGYNRTENEIADRNIARQITYGGNLVYRSKRIQCGLNGVYYRYSLPLQKRDEPYNLYAIAGKSSYNISFDYSYTWKNLHLFGEAAADKNLNPAFLNGLLISVDPRVDLALLHRAISTQYQSINSNAFTENTYPANENGFYTGISIRPAAGWKLDAYADIYTFPWLRYQADAPGGGNDFLIQLTRTPNKQVELITRLSIGTKKVNQPDNNTPVNFLANVSRQSWRTQVNYQFNTSFAFRTRMEMLWYDPKGKNSEKGFLAYLDVLYKPLLSPFSAIARVAYFETSGYDSRIYAYENDVQFSYSIPASAGRGYKYYLVATADVGKKISFWLRLSQTIYPDQKITGTGPDEISCNRKTEVKLQTLIKI